MKVQNGKLYPILISLILSGIISYIFDLKPFLINFIVLCIILTTLWFVSYEIIKLSYTIFPRKKFRYKHLIVLLPLQFILIFIISYIIIFVLQKNNRVSTDSIPKLIFNITIIATLLFTTGFEGVAFIVNWKKYILNAERIEKANLVAKYETLKKQIHPHFLFNGLNTLIGLIENNDKKAGEYTQKLADFLKYLLTYQQKESITLHEELEIVKQYTFIQQVRFNENLHVEYRINDALYKKKVPPLSVQMLVENAIKHNVISNNHPLSIYIYSTDDSDITVKNNLRKKQYRIF